jgi:hypothetical protein
MQSPEHREFQSAFAQKYVSIGKAEGKAEIVLHLVALKFGPLSEEVSYRIQHATPAELDTWAERVLTATSLDELFP